MNDFIYDSVPYPSFVFPQTHPDRLATLGRLFGIPTTSPSNCRMLELGCGDGSNLISHAYSIGNGTFLGIDLSEVEIRTGNETIAKIGIETVELRHCDVTTLDHSELDEFDFIIAHGLFSWVPEHVRTAILSIYRECLAPNGIGYISYNALPGCRIRQITSEMMQYHARSIANPFEKVTLGIDGLKTITKAAEADSLYQTMLGLELEQISERNPSNVFHDDLSSVNHPFYFHEFCDQLAKYDLSFVCEADPSDLLDTKLSAEASNLLDQIATNPLERSQYRDFITGRRFRSSLICHKSAKPTDEPDPQQLANLWISTRLGSNAERTLDSSAVRFEAQSGSSITINHPLTKQVLYLAGDAAPNFIKHSDVLDASKSLLPASEVLLEDIDRLNHFLLQLYLAGHIKLHSYEANVQADVSERPMASRFARHLIESGSKTIPTMTATSIEIEIPAIAKLLLLLNGTRTTKEIAVELQNELGENEFVANIDELVAQNVKTMALAGLLIA